MLRRWFILCLTSLLTAGGASFGRAAQPAKVTPIRTFKEIQTFEHDPNDYTEGLVYLDGVFYESTGQWGRSQLKKYQYLDGKRRILGSVALPSEYFGEGIAVLHGKVVQLTWKSQKGFIYQASDLKRIGEFSYQGEGWGLTTDGKDFYMSDGTPTIRVLDGDKLLNRHECVVKRKIEVKDQGVPVRMLNELELIHGELYANVWQTDRIAVISPKTGGVIRWIDLARLLSPMFHMGQDAVLNGIAYDASGKRLFVTGKLWPTLFQIREVVQKP